MLAFTDSHGDVLGQFTAAGAAMAGSQAYDPWGNVTAATGSLSGLLGFQSAWTDPGTGKDLMGARWYSPSAGDFTSADTMQVPAVPDPAAASPFAYAADNPLDGTDPTGHMISIGSPETNPDYLAETTYANVNAGTVQRAGPAAARAAATAAYTSTEKLVKKIVNPKPKPAKPAKTTKKTAKLANQPHDKPTAPASEGGGVLCNSVASRYAAGPCTLDLPGTASAGGLPSWLGNLGHDILSDLNGSSLQGCLWSSSFRDCLHLLPALLAALAPLLTDGESDPLGGDEEPALPMPAAEAGSEAGVPTAQSLASDVAKQTGGTLKTLKSGYSVTVPQGSRGIVVRIMEEGGGNTNYYRVSVPGLQTFTQTGEVSTDPVLTHIPISSTSLQDILNIISRAGQQ